VIILRYLDDEKPIGHIETIFAYHYRDVFYMVNKYYGPKWELRTIDPKGGTNNMPYLATIIKVRK